MHDYARRQIRDRMMTDSCQIVDIGTRARGTLNESTYEVTFDPEVVVYDGVCLIEPVLAPRSERSDGQDLQVSQYMVSIPAETAGVEIGMELRPTTTGDPSATDLVLVITRVLMGSDEMTRELVCQDRASMPSTAGA